MKNTILTRREAKMIDFKYILCQATKAKYFILRDGGWLSFRTKRDARKMMNYINGEA